MRRTSTCACPANGKSLGEKIFAVFLAFVLVVTLAPSYSWAAEPSASPAEPAAADAAATEAAADAAAAPKAEPAAPAPAEEAPVPAAAPASAPAADDRAATPAPAAAVAIEPDAYVMIQDTKDLDSAYSRVSGEITSGMTLWANVYDYMYDSICPADATWTYQWMSADSQSGTKSDYTPISGQTSQGLVVTDELATQLAGKYIAVTVTDGATTLWGPTASYDNTTISSREVPGPVTPPGVINLAYAHVIEASASFGSASSQADATAAAVGTTLQAAGWKAGALYSPLKTADGITLSWQLGDTANGPFVETATGDTYVVPVSAEGKFLKVVANGGGTSAETKVVSLVAAGAVELGSLSIDAPARLETGATLTAHAFKKAATSWGKGEEVIDGVTFTWKWAAEDPKGYGTPQWNVIPGETGNTLVIPADCAGKWIVATATAGVNEVPTSYTYVAVGPVKEAGTYSVDTVTFTRAGSTYAGQFKAGETIGIIAKEKDPNTGSSVEIPSSALTYTWQIADSKSGPFVDLTDANVHAASFAIPAEYAGKFLKCVVKSGTSTRDRAMVHPVAAADAIDVNKVVLSYDGKGTSLVPGTTLTATATDAAGADVTANGKITWSWYTSASRYASGTKTKIAGANTSSFTIPADDPSYVGKYIFAAADGGMTPEYSSASDIVTKPGAVDLHSVIAAGDAKVGKTLVATPKKTVGSSAKPLGDADKVTYQWQYASTNTTVDSSFVDIAGANAATFDIPASYPDGTPSVGTFLRVKVSSNNEVVSTKKPSQYGGMTTVDPLGPVTEAGVYTLSSVSLSAIAPDKTAGQGFQVGNTIVPQAMVANGAYAEKPAPQDAALKYTWYVADTASAKAAPLGEPYNSADGRLLLSDSLKGKYLYVAVSSGDNEVNSTQGDYGATVPARLVVGAGEYDLLRVTGDPNMTSTNVKLATGDAVKATVQARNFASVNTGDVVTDKVVVKWYVADAKDGVYSELQGVTGADIVVPAAAAGKYLKAVATSGASSVEAVYANPVLDGNSLQALVLKMEGSYFTPSLVYSASGENINDVVSAKAAELGFADVTVKVKSATFNATDPSASAGISAAADSTNGDVTFFSYDPDKYTGYNVTGLQQAKVVFELSRGAETVVYEPSRSITVPWDESKLSALLEKAADGIAIGYAAGDSASSVTGNLTLPYRTGAKNKFEIKWSSPSEQIKITGSGWDPYTGTVTRALADENVGLTASVSLVGGPSGFAIDRVFPVVVKGDPAKVEAAQKDLATKVEAGFTIDKIEDAATDTPVNAASVTGDLGFPTPRQLGVDGKYYKVQYTVDSDAIAVNTYRGNVYRPLPGAAPAKVKITATVTDKSIPEITATKTLEVTIAPLEAADIQSEVQLMNDAKAAFATGILNGQAADAVKGDMHAMKKGYRASDGSFAWSYNVADKVGDGIVLSELPGASEAAGYRLLKSSAPGIVQHENLVVKQPDYNTDVTVSACLKSEKFARYADRYANDPTWGADFKMLAGQDVSATVTVLGLKGAEDPNVSVQCSVIGIDKDGKAEVWAMPASYSLKKGSAASDLTVETFKTAGITAKYDPNGTYGFYLETITSPYDGRELGWDAATGKFWQLFVNGTPSDLAADAVVLNPGDSVVWAYTAFGEPVPEATVKATCSVIGVDKDGKTEVWAPSSAFEMKVGSNAAQLSVAAFAKAGITADYAENSSGWYLNTITSPFDGRVLGWDNATGRFWQLYINGTPSSAYASGVTLNPGDSVVWAYTAWGDPVPPESVSATCAVIGMDANGLTEVWAPSAAKTYPAGSTAADLTIDCLNAAGLTADYDPNGTYGFFMKTITSPDGRVLGYDAGSGKFWQLFVNGAPSDLAADAVVLNPGDSVVWAYTAWGDPMPAEKVSAMCTVIGVDAAGKAETWAASDVFTLLNGSDAADISEAAFAKAGLVADYGVGGWGWYLNTITSPNDGRVLGWDDKTGKYWQLFVNGVPSSLGASSVKIKANDSIVWFYSAQGEAVPDTGIMVKASVIGESASGAQEVWAAEDTYIVKSGATAAQLSEAAFAKAGLTADYGVGSWGWFLSTITSPNDGRVLGWDDATGKYWQLRVNGALSMDVADKVILKPGDSVSWVYAADAVEPAPEGPVVDPDAVRPNLDSAHPMFGGSTAGGNVTSAPTATEGAKLNWVYEYGAGVQGASDPLIIGNNVYVVAGKTLRVIDSQTGVEVSSANIGQEMGYFCRPAYADGLVVIPRADGSLVAFTADQLKCAWISDPLPAAASGSYQALSTLTINGGFAYAGFTVPGGLGASSDLSQASALVCVDMKDGSVKWVKAQEASQSGAPEGYYWAGAAASGSDIIVGNDAGVVSLIDGGTGNVLSTLDGFGGAIRAGVIGVPGEPNTFLVVSRDNGTLNKIERVGNVLVKKGSVAFAVQSTSTPAVANGMAFVCGYDKDFVGTISAIDLSTMTVVGTGRGGNGKAQSAPLVSTAGGKTTAYFTCNGLPGGVYAFDVATGVVTELYVPEPQYQNYTTSSVIADAAGNIYYSNDAGVLFSLAAGPKPPVPPAPAPEGGSTGGNAGSNIPAGAVPLGTVAPTVKPLAEGSTATEATDVQKGAPSKQESAAPEPRATSADDQDAPAAERGFNWLALIGLGIGLVGLIGVLWFILVARRRKDDEEQ